MRAIPEMCSCSCCRVRQGSQIEEDHMRNRQLIVRWIMAHTNAIEQRSRDGKTFFVMTNPRAFHEGAGRLLGEIQRIKGEGDYDAAGTLVETYGVHFSIRPCATKWSPGSTVSVCRRIPASSMPRLEAAEE